MLTNVVLALRDSSGSTFFVSVLSSLPSHPKQYRGTLPSDVGLKEEFLSSTMLQVGLKVRTFRQTF